MAILQYCAPAILVDLLVQPAEESCVVPDCLRDNCFTGFLRDLILTSIFNLDSVWRTKTFLILTRMGRITANWLDEKRFTRESVETFLFLCLAKRNAY